MSKLKEIPIQSTIAWSPLIEQPDLIAAGTVSGTIGADFDTSSQLEIYSLDIKSETPQMSLKGKITANNRFNDLAWGKSNSFSHGILAGAMDNSVISFWDPSKILKGEEPLISLGQRHTGSVNSIHFNQLKSNLIASGGSNSEIFVWDLENPTSPSSYAPDVNSQGLEISCVNWNNVYQHILAASTYSGNIIIWDLKANRQLINFTDKSRRSRYKSIVWDPTVSTHLVAASEDDDYPVIQYWDLRNFQSPIKTLDAHSKGVWGLSWSSFDKSLLLSTAKDGKTLCWNIEKGEVLCEIQNPNSNPSMANNNINLNNSSSGALMMAQQSNAWNFDVQWSPRIPGLLSTCSFSNNVNIYSLQDVNGRNQPASVNSLGVTEPAKKPLLKHTPKWLQRPVGASFGFGGKLVCFSKFKPTPSTPGSPVTPQKPQFKVNIVRVSTDQELQTRSQGLEQTIQSGNYEQYCQDKIDSAASEDEKSIWGFLKLLFSKNERQMILNYLGYDIEYIKTELQKFLKTLPEIQTSSISKDQNENEENSSEEDSKEKTGNLFLNSNGDDFNISPSSSLTLPGSPIQFPGSGNEQMITKALMIGDNQLAIDCCLRLGRLSDALILAHAAGPELWKSTQDAYFEIVKSPFAKVVSCIVKKDFESLVKACDLSDWKATLSVLCTYATTTVLRELSGILGDRLDSEANDTKSATLCYICAGDIDKTVNIWTRSASKDSSKLDLQSFIEKVVIFRNSSTTTSQLPLNDVLALKYSKYAELLASQGNLQSSLRYLSLLSNNPNSAVLLDRVYHATNQHGNIPVPPFPFQFIQVGNKPVNVQNTTTNMINNSLTSNMNSMNINTRPISGGNLIQPVNTFNKPPPMMQTLPVSNFQSTPVVPVNFNQPPPSNFNQPPPNNFNQPPPSNFNQPPPSNFNQPPPNNFNQPPPSNFNQPPQLVGNFTFNQPPSNTFTPVMSTLPINQQLPPQTTTPINEPPPLTSSFVHHPKSSVETSPKDIYLPPPKPNVHNSTSIPSTPTIGTENNVNPQEIVDQIKLLVERILSDHSTTKQVREELNKKISNVLVGRITNGELSRNALDAIQILVKLIQEEDYKTANEKYIQLTSGYWNEIGSASMTGLKRIVELRK